MKTKTISGLLAVLFALCLSSPRAADAAEAVQTLPHGQLYELRELDLNKAQCRERVIARGSLEGVYEGEECGEGCAAVIRLDSGEKAYLGSSCDADGLYGPKGRRVVAHFEVRRFWYEYEEQGARGCSEEMVCVDPPAAASGPDAGANRPVRRKPVEDGKILASGFGVRGLCPPGWLARQDGEHAALRFTSRDGREHITARPLRFTMAEEPERRLIMEWVKTKGGENIRSIEGSVEFTDAKGRQCLIAGYGPNLPALWLEHRDDPQAPDRGAGFGAMMGSIEPDGSARFPVAPDVEAVKAHRPGCVRVKTAVAALRAEPENDARLLDLMPKGALLCPAEPAGDWLRISETDRGDGFAYIHLAYKTPEAYVHKNDTEGALP